MIVMERNVGNIAIFSLRKNPYAFKYRQKSKKKTNFHSRFKSWNKIVDHGLSFSAQTMMTQAINVIYEIELMQLEDDECAVHQFPLPVHDNLRSAKISKFRFICIDNSKKKNYYLLVFLLVKDYLVEHKNNDSKIKKQTESVNHLLIRILHKWGLN